MERPDPRGLPPDRARREAAVLKAAWPRMAIPERAGGERIWAWIERLCVPEHRRPGSPEGADTERWLEAELRALALEAVRADPVPVPAWRAERWSLTIEGRPVPCFWMLNSGFTGPEGVAAPLVWVDDGDGIEAASEALRGRIAVGRIDYRPSFPLKTPAAEHVFFVSDPERAITPDYQDVAFPKNLVGERQGWTASQTSASDLKERARDVHLKASAAGAVGVVMLLTDYPSAADRLFMPYDGTPKAVPGLWVGREAAPTVEAAARRGLTARLTLEGCCREAVTHNLWGVLPGLSEDSILITSHHDSAFQGAVEDASGVAHVLAQAWAWSRVPQENRPLTLVFGLMGAHFAAARGAVAFAHDHPDVVGRARVLLTLEHLAAKGVRVNAAGGYEETGQPHPSYLMISRRPEIIAPVWAAMERAPAPATICTPMPNDRPISDASGIVATSRCDVDNRWRGEGVPFVSWLSAPLYLLEAADTLEMIDRARLDAYDAAVTEIVAAFMADAR